MYKSGRKFLTWTFVLVLLIFFARYVFVSFFVKVGVENASRVYFDDYVDAVALVIRDEVLIKSDSDFARVVVDDKKKLAKNQTLYLSYSSEDDLDNDFNLSSKKVYDDLEINNIDNLNFNINEKIKSITHQKKYDSYLENLIVNREKMIKNIDYKKESEGIVKRPDFKEIKSEYNGIFSCFVDGFEDELSTNMDFKSLNFNNYRNSKNVENNVIGKIVTNNKCVFLCDKKIQGNGYFCAKFGTSNDEVRCKLIDSYDDVSVFEAEVDDSLVNSRLENIKIKIKSVEGIKIKKTAIHSVGGEKGVFIRDKKVVKFKEVSIKYESKDYVICEDDESNSDSIRVNDEIIVSGNNLYDGKILMY